MSEGNDKYSKTEYELRHERLSDRVKDNVKILHDKIDANTENLNREITRSTQRSDEGSQGLKEEIVTNQKKLDDHSCRLSNLELWRSGTDTEIKHLVEQIASLVKSLNAMMMSVFAMLAGFIIWYIQKLGGGLF